MIKTWLSSILKDYNAEVILTYFNICLHFQTGSVWFDIWMNESIYDVIKVTDDERAF
jgi:hypothetical protein